MRVKILARGGRLRLVLLTIFHLLPYPSLGMNLPRVYVCVFVYVYVYAYVCAYSLITGAFTA